MRIFNAFTETDTASMSVILIFNRIVVSGRLVSLRYLVIGLCVWHILSRDCLCFITFLLNGGRLR